MHEYSLVLSLIERVEAEALANKAKSIKRVTIRVGALSGVEPELLSSAFEIARTGTKCEDATLVVVRTPANWECPDCHAAIDPEVGLLCPACGTGGRLVGGDEILFERMEIEV
jgi:hydrogenase nickel incorporation protein HypA/HybF